MKLTQTQRSVLAAIDATAWRDGRVVAQYMARDTQQTLESRIPDGTVSRPPMRTLGSLARHGLAQCRVRTVVEWRRTAAGAAALGLCATE